MADTVTSHVLYDGIRRYAVHLTNQSDGTGESGVIKVDISTLTDGAGDVATYSTVDRIVGTTNGFSSVGLAWDHTTDDEIAVLSGLFDIDFSDAGGLTDPKSAGGTGDIILTTVGAATGAAYDITIYLRPKS